MELHRKPYPSDVSDAEWAFVAPYLTLMREDAPQREYSLRDVFNGLRWLVRTGASWRMMHHDLPPRDAIYQQTQRWIKAGESLVFDLRVVLRLAEDRQEQPTATIFDFHAWHAVMSDCPKRWQVFITPPLPSSFSNAS